MKYVNGLLILYNLLIILYLMAISKYQGIFSITGAIVSTIVLYYIS